MSVLKLDTAQLKASVDGEDLPVSNRLFRLLSILALHAQRPSPKPAFLGLEEVVKLEGYSALSKESLKASVRRDVRSLEEKGYSLIVSPPSKGSEFFKLAESYTVLFDREAERFSPDLGLEPSGAESPFLEGLEFHLECALIEAQLEGEGGHEVQPRLEALLERVEGAERARVLLYQSQVLERQGLLERAWEWLIQAETTWLQAPLPALKPLLNLQRIRLLRLEGSLNEAEKRILEGLRSTRDPYLSCRLTLLRGLVVLGRTPGEPKEAMPHFYRALQLAFELHFWWGVQAAYANLGLACFRQAHHPSVQPLARRHHDWLEQAGEWFERNMGFCGQTGFQHDSPEAALYLCRVRRLLGRPELALVQAELALTLAQRLNHPRSQAEAQLELGELAWSAAPDRAQVHWQSALHLDPDPTYRHHLLERIGTRLEGNPARSQAVETSSTPGLV